MWKDTFLAYFDTGGAGNEPTEAINGIIELRRRTARGCRNPTNYQLRILLIRRPRRPPLPNYERACKLASVNQFNS